LFCRQQRQFLFAPVGNQQLPEGLLIAAGGSGLLSEAVLFGQIKHQTIVQCGDESLLSVRQQRFV